MEKYTLRPLTEKEQKRLLEIRFYLVIDKILENNNYSYAAFDNIERLGVIAGCNVTLLRQLVRDYMAQEGIAKPSKYEIGILLRSHGVSFRKIRALTGIHQQTVYGHLKKYNAMEEEFLPRLEDNELATIEQFITGLEQLVDIINI